MLTETVKIALVDRQIVWLEAQSPSQCSRCLANASCHAALSALSNSRQVTSTFALASATLGAGVLDKPQQQMLNTDLTSPFSLNIGDTLQLGLKESSFLGLAFLFYVMPLVMMITGLIVSVGLGANELMSVGSTFAGLAVGLVFLRVYSQKIDFREQYQPVILLSE